MIVDYPNADALNAYLFEMVIKLERVELELWKRGYSPTLDMIMRGAEGPEESLFSFHDFCQERVIKSVRSDGTKKNLLRTLECLSEFCEGYSWDDIDISFVQRFEMWLSCRGFALNTVIKHLRNLRTLVNEAIVSGHFSYKETPFKIFKISHPKSSHRFLLPDELTRMENVQTSGRLSHTKDAFLFCCYTGLRFSDFCRLKEDFFCVEDGCLWLKMKLKKTATDVMIPVSLLFDGKGEGILRKYDSVEAFARICSNSKVNAGLKLLQMSAGIKTPITFHTARHTCATLLCHQGVPITTVQKILGHTSITTTQIYQDVMAETIVKDLKRTGNRKRL